MSTFRLFGYERLKMLTDGEGVTTLFGGYGCPLACKYCLNPQCSETFSYSERTVEQIYATAMKDALYFDATGGGITFGGGEPLLQAEFIRDFIIYAKEQGRNWKFTLETSLAVKPKSLELLDGLIDFYLVDCKDMNEKIYRKYTGHTPKNAYANLRYLAQKYPEKLCVRIPLIPGYNTDADRDFSEKTLREMGVRRVDRFTYDTDAGKKKKAKKQQDK